MAKAVRVCQDCGVVAKIMGRGHGRGGVAKALGASPRPWRNRQVYGGLVKA